MILTIKEVQAIEIEMLKEVSEICERFHITYFLAYGSVLGAIRHNGPIPWDSDVDIIVPYNQFDKFIAIVREQLPRKFYLDYYDTNKFYPALFPRIGLRGYSTKELHIDVFKLTGIPSDKKEQLHFRKRSRFYRNIFLPKNTFKEYFGNLGLKRRIYLLFIRILLFPIPKKYIIQRFEKHCSKYPYERSEYVANANGGYGMKEIVQKSFYGEGILCKYANINVKIPENYDTYLIHFYNNYMQFPPEDKRRVKAEYRILEIDTYDK